MAAMYEAEAKKGIENYDLISDLIDRFVFLNLGEIYELKAELNSDKRDRKKEAVKKVKIFNLQKQKKEHLSSF